jgi:hypothetical protein
LSVLLLFLAAGCQSRNDETQSADVAAYDSIESVTDSSAQATGDAVEFVDCVRGPAERVVKATVEPQPQFELDRIKNIGTETLQFQNGDRLIITNGGCEYFVLTFRFETSRFSADTADMLYWLDKSAVLMREITEAIDAPLDLNDGVAAIARVKGPATKYDLHQEIVYADGEIRQFVALNRVQQLTPTRYAVEVMYALGPL